MLSQKALSVCVSNNDTWPARQLGVLRNIQPNGAEWKERKQGERIHANEIASVQLASVRAPTRKFIASLSEFISIYCNFAAVCLSVCLSDSLWRQLHVWRQSD